MNTYIWSNLNSDAMTRDVHWLFNILGKTIFFASS